MAGYTISNRAIRVTVRASVILTISTVIDPSFLKHARNRDHDRPPSSHQGRSPSPRRVEQDRTVR